MKSSVALVLWFVACGTPPAAEAPPVKEEAPPVVAPAVEEDASAPVVDASVTDASVEAEAATVAVAPRDAGAEAEAERPLEIKGARRCTDEEIADEVCFVNRKGGLCREGQCISLALCPKYCALWAARSHEDCMVEPEPECKQIPECASTFRKLHADCKKMIAAMTRDCVSLTCSLVRTLPPQQTP